MNTAQASTGPLGQVVSIHLHPATPGSLLQPVETVQLVEDKGIQGDERYFGRISSQTGKPSKRQVSLIEREQIREHADALRLPGIPPGAVRSNIETTGIDLVPLVNCQIEIGEALLFINAPREPCAKMDAICQGLRELMLRGKQGVMAEVRRSGTVRVGDRIVVRQPA